jgi:hypothetical protein
MPCTGALLMVMRASALSACAPSAGRGGGLHSTAIVCARNREGEITALDVGMDRIGYRERVP